MEQSFVNALQEAVSSTFKSKRGHSVHHHSRSSHQYGSPKYGSHDHHKNRHHRRRRSSSSEHSSSPVQRLKVTLQSETCENVDPVLVLDVKLKELLRSLTPTQSERQRKLSVIKDAQRALAEVGLRVDVYGSLLTGLVTPSSDIDCVMTADLAFPQSAKRMPEALERTLRNLANIKGLSARERKMCCSGGIRAVAQAIRNTRQFGSVLTIAHARVPIVKSRHREEDVKVDFSFEQDGLSTSMFLCEEMQRPGNECARGLIVLIKTMITNWALDDPSVGGLGSFPIAMMVLWYLQCEATRLPSEIRGSLGVLFAGFLKFFGSDFDFRRQGLDYLQRKAFTKPVSSELFIVNPVSAGTNCAKAAHLFAMRVVPRLTEASKVLSELIHLNATPAKVETSLQRLFRDAFPLCEDWNQVTRMAGRYAALPQHSWDPTTKLYTGSVVD